MFVGTTGQWMMRGVTRAQYTPPRSQAGTVLSFSGATPGDFKDNPFLHSTVPIENVEFIVIDTETMGLDPTDKYAALNPEKSTLIELTAIRYKNGKAVGRYSTLVHPGNDALGKARQIPEFIRNLTNITDEMVKDAPNLKTVLEGFLKFCGDTPLIVGHHTNFDIGQIRARLQEVGLIEGLDKVVLNNTLCTKTLVQQIIPETRKDKNDRGLGAIAKRYGISNPNRHRSESDVATTAQVLYALIQSSKIPLKTVGDLFRLQGPPITSYDGLPPEPK